jgi:murein DD-endopeptidase MepM/ murein hydrolase activator NlpD
MVSFGKTRTFELGAGICDHEYEENQGTANWMWPTEGEQIIIADQVFIPNVHPGIDIAISMDQQIYAVDNGVIVYSGWSSMGYGNLIVIDHMDGWHSFYAHLDSVMSTCGQRIFKGKVVGLGGATGYSQGPNLHFELRFNGEPINPLDILPID